MADNTDEYGQVAFLAALTARDKKAFSRLTGIRMVPME
jgi:hypothetical protein